MDTASSTSSSTATTTTTPTTTMPPPPPPTTTTLSSVTTPDPGWEHWMTAVIVVAVVAVTVAVTVAVICFLRRRGSSQVKGPPSLADIMPPVPRRLSHALQPPTLSRPAEEREGRTSLGSGGEVNSACDFSKDEVEYANDIEAGCPGSPSPGRRSSSGSSVGDQYENTLGPCRQSSSHSSSYGDYVEARDSDQENSSFHSANTHSSSNSKKNDSSSSSRKNLPNGLGNNGGYMSMQTKHHVRPLSEDRDSGDYEEPNAQLPSPPKPCLSASPGYVNLSTENLPLEQDDPAETVSWEYENSTVMKLAANLKSNVLLSIPMNPVTTGVQSKVRLKPVGTSAPRNPDSCKVQSSTPKHSVGARVQNNVPLNPVSSNVENGVPQNSVGASPHSGVPRNPAAASSHRTVPENSEHTKPSPVLSKNVSRGPECSPKPKKSSAQPRSKDGGWQVAKRGNPEGACVVSIKPAATQPVPQQALKPAGVSEGRNFKSSGQGKQSHSAALMPPLMRATKSQEPKSHHPPTVVEEDSGEEDSDSESYENVQSDYENTPSRKQETGPPPTASAAGGARSKQTHKPCINIRELKQKIGNKNKRGDLDSSVGRAAD